VSSGNSVTRPAAPGDTLARGALVSTLAFLASNLRAFFTLLIARLLGQAVLGTFGLAWAVTDLAAKFGTLGLDYSVTARVARSEALGDRRGSRQVLRDAVWTTLSAGLLVALAGAWLTYEIGPRAGLRPEAVTATAALLLAVPGLALYRVCNGLSRGMKVMQHDVYSRGFTESLVSTAVLLVAVLAGARLLAPVLAAVAGTTASGLVALALARRLFGDRAGQDPFGAAPTLRTEIAANPVGSQLVSAAGSWHQLLRGSIPIAVYDLLNIAVMRVDVIMLGLFVGRAPGVTPETLGIYAAAVEVAGGLRKLSQAFTPILTPVLAEQLAAGDLRGAERSYGSVARWMLALLLPIVIVLALAGGVVMSLFGRGFEAGAPWMAVAAAACALNAFVGLGEIVLMIERPAWNVMNTAAASITAVMLNLVLIPRLGALGAALGMLAPYALQGLLRGIEVPRLLGWRWPWATLVRPWALAIAALPPALLVRVLFDGRQWEAAAGVLYALGYFIAWRIAGLEPEDRAVISRLWNDRLPGWRRVVK
jgi:O-antigen/teichoic acid export membrane protein